MVLTKTRNDLKRTTTTWNELQRARNNLKRPSATWHEIEQTRNDLKRPTTFRKWPQKTQPTTTWAYQQRAKKDARRPTTGRFWRTTRGNRFSCLIRFLPNIWLQSFENCFIENHGKRKTYELSKKKSNFDTDKTFRALTINPYYLS